MEFKTILIIATLSLAAYCHRSYSTATPAMVTNSAVENIKAVEMQKEIWKDIDGYKDIYQVSSIGNVRSLNRVNNIGQNLKGIELVKCLDKSNGYLKVELSKNGIVKTNRLHNLVANAFISNNENKKCINHIDGNKLNNTVLNLERCTYSENNKHAYNIGLKISSMKNKFGSKHIRSKPVNQIDLKTGKIIGEFECTRQVHRDLGYSYSSIAATCRGVQKTAYGFKWSYKNS